MKYEEFDFENADKYYDIRKSNRSIAFSEQKLEVSVNTDELQLILSSRLMIRERVNM